MRVIPTFAFLLLVGVVSLSGCSSSKGLPQSPAEIVLSEIQFKPRKPEEWRLSNGLTVMFLADRELPVVSGQLFVRGGSFSDPADKVGLASAVGALMREGSIVGLSPEELDLKLDGLAASIESSIGDEFGTVTFRSLKETLEEVFPLFAAVVRTPAFSQERLELWRTITLQGIDSRKDSSEIMSSIAFSQLLYGEDSPQGRVSTRESIKRIGREDVVTFYQRLVRPEGSLLLLTGDLSRGEAEMLAAKYFAEWTNQAAPLAKVILPPLQKKPGVYVLPRDFKQAVIAIGHEGPKRFGPDHYPIMVFNRYFGFGAFGSVLFSEVRSKRGLAYSVGGGIIPDRENGKAYFEIGTRVEQAAAGLQAILQQIREAQRRVPSALQIAETKQAVERAFVFSFDEPEDVLARAAQLRLLEYPQDYDAAYLERIAAVTPEQVLGATRHLKPDEVIVVIVGAVDPARIQAELGNGFKVQQLDFDVTARLAKSGVE